MTIDKSDHLQKELGIAAYDGLEEGVTVLGSFGDRFAECMGVNTADIAGEEEMMGGNGRCWHSMLVGDVRR